MSQYVPFLNYNLEDILTLFGRPSFSSFYMVFMPVGQVGSDLADAFNDRNLFNNNKNAYRLEEKISLLCSDATIPGAEFNTVEVRGNRQGVVERYPNYKIFPNVDFSFMVDDGHSVLRLFDTWMNFISPLEGDEDSSNSYYRFRYPEDYILDFYVVKFEKNEGAYSGENDPKNMFEQSEKTVYKFKRAYPVNFSSIPLSYDQSSLIKATIRFQYDRFFTFDVKNNKTPDFIEEFIDSIVKGG